MNDCKLEKISETIWEIPKTGKMRVPARVYAFEKMIPKICQDNAPRQAANEEALDAEKTWLGFYALPEADFGTFGKRIKRALSTILETV